MGILKKAIVAGHLCLDILPNLDRLPPGSFMNLFQPGHLIIAGEAHFSTGGPVSNTGLALHILGIPTRLIAKIGSDPFGNIVRQLVDHFDPNLTVGILSDPSTFTSYTVIINPPGMDRIFLHCPGANDTFYSADIDFKLVEEADLFHFGYPPLMRRMYIDEGKELAEILRRVKATSATTSLDMAFPDPTQENGKANWHAILKEALPFVDIFTPSIEELLFMLRKDTYEKLRMSSVGGNLLTAVTPSLLHDISDQMISWGVSVVLLKLGERGLYLRTADSNKLASIGRAAPKDISSWANIELWAPCFKVNVVGTTGSGDATIAGFLSALLRDYKPKDAITAAVAVGACNVEAYDALSGLLPWEKTMQRIANDWERHQLSLAEYGWKFDPQINIWTYE